MPRKQPPSRTKRTRRNADQPATPPVVTPTVTESPTVAQVIKADATPVAPTAAPAPGAARPNRGAPPSPIETGAAQGRSGPRESLRTPVVLQHTALQVYRSLRKKIADPSERRQRAFAIATASMQNAGVMVPGSRRLTPYGRRIEREHVREDPEVLARKLRAYERMLRAGDFDRAVAEGRMNGASAEWFVTLEDNGVCEIESHWPDEARANGHRDQVDDSIRRGVWRTINGGSPTAVVRHRSHFVGQPRNNGDDLIAKIRETAQKAADFRLHGAIDQAKHLDAELDHLMARAERLGQHDAAVEAEETGREAARGRRNGQVEDESTAPQWIHLSPDVAQMAQHWWWGQGDPLYAVVSRHFAGLSTWDVSGSRTLIQATPDEIERLQQVAAEQLEAEGSDEEMSAAYSVVHEGALFDIGEGPERSNAHRPNGRRTAERPPVAVSDLVRMGHDLMAVLPNWSPGNASESEIRRLHRQHFPAQYRGQQPSSPSRSNAGACMNPQHRRNGSHQGSACRPSRMNAAACANPQHRRNGSHAGSSCEMPRSNATGWAFKLDVEAMDAALLRVGNTAASEVTDWMVETAKTGGAQSAARVLLLRAYDGQERDVPQVVRLLESHNYDEAVAIAAGTRQNGRSTGHREMLEEIRHLAEETEVAEANGSYGLARRLRGTLHSLLEQASISGSEVRFEADKAVERGVRAAKHQVGRANPTALQMAEWDAAHTMSAEQNELLKRIWQCGYDMAKPGAPRSAEALRLNELAGELRAAAKLAKIPVAYIEQAEEDGFMRGCDYSMPRSSRSRPAPRRKRR
jgi:hypothetical protein